MSAEGLELYAVTLSGFPDEDVRAVIERSARSKRAEGEKAWPALGDLLDPLERIADKRRELQRQERDRQERLGLFWQVARERIEERGAFLFNGIEYHSLDEVNEAPTSYKGTLPGGLAAVDRGSEAVMQPATAEAGRSAPARAIRGKEQKR